MLDKDDLYKDQTGFSWHDPLWLQHNRITEANWVDYFSRSIFHDKSKELVYKAALVNPHSDEMGFRVTKSFKEITGRLKWISIYFIIDGIIFQAATLKAIFEERLERASYSLKNAFENIHKNANYSLKQTVPWKEEEKDEEFDYDFLYNDTPPKTAEAIFNAALNSLDDI